MAKNSKWGNGDSIYSAEEDIDDDTFLKHSSSGSSGYMLPNSVLGRSTDSANKNEDLEKKRQELLQMRENIESRTLQSTQRSLSYLKNSEEVGLATAEELVRQREQLERTEERLDDINTTLRFSQKHIQGIKSVFGGLKKMFSGSSNEQMSSTPRKPPETGYKYPLDSVFGKTNSDMQLAQKNPHHPSLREDIGYDSPPTTPTDAQVLINANLDEMSGNITQLKVLAGKLGEEIQSHNEIIENVISKAEKADTQLIKQNKDMKRLLK